MRLFIFVRHGQTTLNVAGIVNGDPRRPAPLTPLGEQQARDLGEQLRNAHLDLVVCSRFLRTRQTAEVALQGRSVPTLIDPDFDDVDVGELDGAPIPEYSAWKRSHDHSDRFPGGESLDDAAQRYSDALISLLYRPEQSILTVCHERPVRLILEVLDGRGWRPVPNAQLYLLDEDAIRTAAYRLAASVPPTYGAAA